MSKRAKLTKLPPVFSEFPLNVQKKIFSDLSLVDIVSLLKTNRYLNDWFRRNEPRLKLFRLPSDLQKEIVANLSFQDIVSLLRTSKAFNRWATNNDNIWQVIYERNFPDIPLRVVLYCLDAFYPGVEFNLKEITLSVLSHRVVHNGDIIYFAHQDGTEIFLTRPMFAKGKWSNEGVRQPDTTDRLREFLQDLSSTLQVEIQDPKEFVIRLNVNAMKRPYTVIYIVTNLLRMGFYINPSIAVGRNLLKSCISCTAEQPKGKCSECEQLYCESCFEKHVRKEH